MQWEEITEGADPLSDLQVAVRENRRQRPAVFIRSSVACRRPGASRGVDRVYHVWRPVDLQSTVAPGRLHATCEHMKAAGRCRLFSLVSHCGGRSWGRHHFGHLHSSHRLSLDAVYTLCDWHVAVQNLFRGPRPGCEVV